MKILIQSKISREKDEVVAGFDLELFKALKPPLLNLEVPRFDGCQTGDEVHLEIKAGPIKKKWVSLITDHGDSKEEWYFVDEGKLLPAPLKRWRHKHIVRKINDESTLIIDDIEYSTNNLMMDILIYPAMFFQFWLRKPAYKKFFKK